MNGNLIVRVYTDGIGQPIIGAKVAISGNGVNLLLVTNDLGETESVSLPAPDLQVSLVPSTQIAYGTYNVIVSKFGIETKEIRGVEIFPTITSFQDVFMTAKDEGNSRENVVTIPDYYVGSWPPKIPETPKESRESRVLGRVIIPEYVIVHDGVPSNSAASNYYVPYADYIKNIASSEIYPTWPVETLKANIHAIVSFTLNRIYTEWYKSKGQDFTITSSTAYDHKFIFGRTIFESISNVVDQIFDQYIEIGTSYYPFLAQYCDGKIVPERPNWLSQWGSKDLGDRGYSAIQIIKYYYTSAANLRQAESIEGLPTSFPGYNLLLGSCGEDVQVIQNQLNTIRNNYPAIPRIEVPDGHYTQQTQNSVKIFQKVFNLPQTGIVDYSTWYKISYIYTAITKIAEGINA
ncbi:MAG: peptidoglycan-binding protein [Oscillospiraceae bacterium]|nr:peptidoglycan-binding protein [Oscillospiraceae bacterium]